MRGWSGASGLKGLRGQRQTFFARAEESMSEL